MRRTDRSASSRTNRRLRQLDARPPSGQEKLWGANEGAFADGRTVLYGIRRAYHSGCCRRIPSEGTATQTPTARTSAAGSRHARGEAMP